MLYYSRRKKLRWVEDSDPTCPIDQCEKNIRWVCVKISISCHDRIEHTENYERYVQVWDGEEDITAHAPPVLKAFWEATLERIEMCVRYNEEHLDGDDARRANDALYGSLDKLATHYGVLVSRAKEEAQSAGSTTTPNQSPPAWSECVWRPA